VDVDDIEIYEDESRSVPATKCVCNADTLWLDTLWLDTLWLDTSMVASLIWVLIGGSC